MRVPRSAHKQGLRRLGIILLISGLVPIPLPEPDFHNIRHHDGPGEVCEHHDHLLRWHPGAGSADDVAILHWHWYLPLSEEADGSSSGTGPALHAHVVDWLGSSWEDGPRIVPDDSSGLIGRIASSAQTTLSPELLPAGGMAIVPDPGRHPSFAFRTPLARRASLNSLLQRWVC